MSLTPRVSIVLPTYNRATTLRRAIDSVLAQSVDDFELIVVDDASTDATTAVLSVYADRRLRVIRRQQRAGAASARNDGIRAAAGEWIAFQDSDDEWLPHKLQLQLALSAHCGSDVGWIGGAYRTADQTISSPRLVRGDDYDGDLLVGAPFVTPTWLVRRTLLLALNGFDAAMPCLEDWDLIFRLAGHCRFRAVPEVVLQRHAAADSLFGDTDKRRAGLEVLLTRHRARWLREPARYARWCTELGRLHALHGDIAGSRRWLSESLRQRPLQLRGAGLWLAGMIDGRLLKRVSRSRYAVLRI